MPSWILAVKTEESAIRIGARELMSRPFRMVEVKRAIFDALGLEWVSVPGPRDGEGDLNVRQRRAPMGERGWWHRLGRLRIEVRPDGEIPLKKWVESEPMRVIRFGVGAILVCYSLTVLLRGEIKAFLIGTLTVPAALGVVRIYLWYQKRRQEASVPEDERAR